jgi:hypothetical protein
LPRLLDVQDAWFIIDRDDANRTTCATDADFPDVEDDIAAGLTLH